MTPTRLLLLVPVLVALACQRAVEPVETPPAESTKVGGNLTVEMTGFRSDEGSALVYLFSSAEAFPSDYEAAVRTRKAEVRDGKVTVVLEAVPAGTWAISVIHDEDDDGELRTNFIGIPREGVGTSNNPAARMGPPRWDDAKFDLDADLTQKIGVRYP